MSTQFPLEFENENCKNEKRKINIAFLFNNINKSFDWIPKDRDFSKQSHYDK